MRKDKAHANIHPKCIVYIVLSDDGKCWARRFDVDIVVGFVVHACMWVYIHVLFFVLKIKQGRHIKRNETKTTTTTTTTTMTMAMVMEKKHGWDFLVEDNMETLIEIDDFILLLIIIDFYCVH